jgi:hypothetical protein
MLTQEKSGCQAGPRTRDRRLGTGEVAMRAGRAQPADLDVQAIADVALEDQCDVGVEIGVLPAKRRDANHRCSHRELEVANDVAQAFSRRHLFLTSSQARDGPLAAVPRSSRSHCNLPRAGMNGMGARHQPPWRAPLRFFAALFPSSQPGSGARERAGGNG